MKFYSAQNRGFYDSDINTIPADAVEITVEVWQQLMVEQSAGKTIQPDADGYPVAVAPDLNIVPASVSPRQFRYALKTAGLLNAVEAHMATFAADDNMRIDWEYATEFRRDYPGLAAMAQLLNKTDEDIDNLFRVAAAV